MNFRQFLSILKQKNLCSADTVHTGSGGLKSDKDKVILVCLEKLVRSFENIFKAITSRDQ